MHHVGVRLHSHQLLDANAAVLAHAPQVVAREVHEHHVLGSFLLVGEQVGCELVILFIGRSAGSRPGDRIHHDTPILDAHEGLGRCADERRSGHVDEEHIGRGIHMPQRAVQRERLRRRSHVESLGEDDLDAIAVGDELAGLRYPGAVFVGRAVRGHRPSHALSPSRERYGRVERREDAGNTARGGFALARDVMRDHEERVTNVIETNDGVVDRERRLWEPQDVA